MLIFKFQIPKFNNREYIRALRRRTILFRNEVIKAFIIEVLKQLPVYSGASAATLIPLGKLVNMSLGSQIHPKAKGPFTAKNHGIPAGRRKGKAHVQGTENTNRIGFDFSTSLLQFVLNETNSMGYSSRRKSTPWGVLEDGERAMKSYISRNKNRIFPDWRNFITILIRGN